MLQNTKIELRGPAQPDEQHPMPKLSSALLVDPDPSRRCGRGEGASALVTAARPNVISAQARTPSCLENQQRFLDILKVLWIYIHHKLIKLSPEPRAGGWVAEWRLCTPLNLERTC
jgi:hypothetical protein